MKNRLYKLLCILLAVVLTAGILTAVPLTTGAASNGNNIYPSVLDGECGENAHYYLFPDCSMAIFGKGAITDYELTADGASTAPWYSDSTVLGASLFMNKFAVEHGITRIGDYCFYFPPTLPTYIVMRAQLYNIDIADTVTSIGKYAFYNQLLEEVMLPDSVKQIGLNAFGSMANLKKITYYGDPATLQWEYEENDTEFPNGIDIHVLSTCDLNGAHVQELITKKHIRFIKDIVDNPYANADAVDRNIAAYYGAANSHVFGGASPFIIVGRFDTIKKSLTYGSSGFASCVKQNDKYYLLTDNATGALNEANRDTNSGKATSYAANARTDLRLQISHEYIGPNTVKMIYTLTNKTNSPMSGLQLGGAGDIKIGADDYASIEPLTENDKQVGFYMKSTQAAYDQAENGDCATLGFIGKGVKKEQSGEASGDNLYKDTNFFYGKVATTVKTSAAGIKTMVLLPERIFTPNDGSSDSNAKSQETGSFDGSRRDSGMSFHWDNITLEPNSSESFAVLFSVYGSNDSSSAGSIIEDSKKQDSDFFKVTWKNADGTTLLEQSVEQGKIPQYPFENPEKASDSNYDYTFRGWDPQPVAVTGDAAYTAQYDAHQKEQPEKLFTGHSLTLEGDIGLNFFLNVTEAQVTQGSGVDVDFSWHIMSADMGEDKDQTRTFHLVTDKKITVETDQGNKTYYLAKCNVPAAEMAYTIHATATIDGVLQEETNDYSVKQYGEELLDAPPGTYAKQDKLVTLAEEMLNYGARAQDVFRRKDVPYANADIRGYSMGNVTEQDFIDAVKAQNGGRECSDMRAGAADFGLNYAGCSLVYQTQTTLRHFYTIADQSAFTTAKNAAPTLFNDVLKAPYVIVEFRNIPAAELDQFRTFTAGGHTYEFSALDFARNKFLAANSTNDARELAKATYLYNQAANAYFDR